MKTKNNAIAIFFALIGSTTYAQIVFDLAEKKNTTETISSNLKPELIFKNLNPSVKYSFDINMETEEIPPFATSTFQASDNNCVQNMNTKELNKNLDDFFKEETTEE
ncbi:MAG: hypothetical protein K2Q22_09140, partial [Cytophagales bacterium]|nr:hypothetical protein [Cytophagales bacterium]